MAVVRPLVRSLPVGFALVVCGCGSSTAPDATSDVTTDGTIDVDAMDAADTTPDSVSDAPLDAAVCVRGPERNGPYARVQIAGDRGTAGIIDPSVVYPAGASVGLMTYTTVPDPAHVHIAIASSADHGATWTWAADVTQAIATTIPASDASLCGSTMCTGTLAQESSSLVLDPIDPDPNRHLKVFTFTYFFGTTMHFDVSYLAMWTAPAPNGPWSETKLFGWHSTSSISSTGVMQNIQTDPRLAGLHDCIVVGEPGAFVRASGTIDLALGCPAAMGGTGTIDIRLVRSTDHGQTWDYVSTLLTPDDALALGSTTRQVNGPDLFVAGGAVHMVVTPMGTVNQPGGPTTAYHGCVVVPIADLDAGTVGRCNGAPILESEYLGQPGQFVGACSAAEGASVNGMLIPVPDFAMTPPFQIFGAGASLP